MVHQFKKAPNREEACCLPGEGLTDEEFASFCKTPEEIKKLPDGLLEYIDGTKLYKDGANQLWTKKQWEKRFGYDPEPIWNRMKGLNIVILGGRNRDNTNQKILVVGRNPAQEEY